MIFDVNLEFYCSTWSGSCWKWGLKQHRSRFWQMGFPGWKVSRMSHNFLGTKVARWIWVRTVRICATAISAQETRLGDFWVKYEWFKHVPVWSFVGPQSYIPSEPSSCSKHFILPTWWNPAMNRATGETASYFLKWQVRRYQTYFVESRKRLDGVSW